VILTLLQKSELGPHANEKQMPSWLFKLLELDGDVKTVNKFGSDGKMKKVKECANMAPGVVPVLAQLVEQDGYTQYAYMCDPAVKHISKLKKEGQ
jgi:zinc finger-containing ubiquitin peptidase 1